MLELCIHASVVWGAYEERGRCVSGRRCASAAPREGMVTLYGGGEQAGLWTACMGRGWRVVRGHRDTDHVARENRATVHKHFGCSVLARTLQSGAPRSGQASSTGIHPVEKRTHTLSSQLGRSSQLGSIRPYKWYSEADAGPGAEAGVEAGAGIGGFPKWTNRPVL
eukprot:scaffold119457_cov60-Phaeocystis_antarctica.AAC.2